MLLLELRFVRSLLGVASCCVRIMLRRYIPLLSFLPFSFVCKVFSFALGFD